MRLSDVIGSLGVAILLVAFALNIAGYTLANSRLNLALNFLGASLACAASVMIGFIPFVVLEGLWSVVAVASLIRLYGQR